MNKVFKVKVKYSVMLNGLERESRFDAYNIVADNDISARHYAAGILTNDKMKQYKITNENNSTDWLNIQYCEVKFVLDLDSEVEYKKEK